MIAELQLALKENRSWANYEPGIAEVRPCPTPGRSADGEPGREGAGVVVWDSCGGRHDPVPTTCPVERRDPCPDDPRPRQGQGGGLRPWLLVLALVVGIVHPNGERAWGEVLAPKTIFMKVYLHDEWIEFRFGRAARLTDRRWGDWVLSDKVSCSSNILSRCRCWDNFYAKSKNGQ